MSSRHSVPVPSLTAMKATRDFLTCLREQRYVLAEGAVIERVRRSHPELLDPRVENAAMIYSEAGRRELQTIYKEYLAIGASFDLPMVVFAPTWRASESRLQDAGFTNAQAVNGDSVRFVREVVAGYGSYAAEVYVGGLMACANDAYKPEQTLPRKEAVSYHAAQAEALAKADADFIMAATLPAMEEAVGLAQLLATFSVPYMLSFVLRQNGKLLDGTPLWQAIERIDQLAPVPPAYYMVNCVHPLNFGLAILTQMRKHEFVETRVIGLQANTSRLSPEQLDGAEQLDEDDPDEWATTMRYVSRICPLKIAGGCCGTDARHIAALAQQLTEEVAEVELRNAKTW